MKQHPERSAALPQECELVRELLSVAVAVIRSDGTLVDANEGLRRLVAAPTPVDGFDMTPFFARPRFEELISAATLTDEATLYRGIFNIGAAEKNHRELSGELRRVGENFLFVAEHRIEDLEHMSDMVLRLNDRLTDAQRQLVRTNSTLRLKVRELEKNTLIDPLTELPNRQHLQQMLVAEVSRSTRARSIFSVALAATDPLEQSNDEHGHGDVVLEVFAQILRNGLRAGDFIARRDGDEFTLILPNTGLDGAAIAAERIRKRVEATPMEAPRQNMTASFAVAQWSAEERPEALFARVAAALSRCREKGRNRIEIALAAVPEDAQQDPDA